MRSEKAAKAFGKVLRRHRKAAALSQMALAEAADLDRTYISLLELGQRQPSLTVILMLAKAMEVSPSILLKETLDELGMPR